MRHIPFLAFLLLAAGILPPSGKGQTLIKASPAATWTNACSEDVEVQVKVYKDVPAYPGLYLWDYEFDVVDFEYNPYTTAGLWGVRIS